MSWRKVFWLSAFLLFSLVGVFSYFESKDFLYTLYLLVPLFCLGLYDILQKHNNVLRNYPIVGHFRYMLLGIRPEIQQYFIESEQNGKPFSEEMRELVYSDAKRIQKTLAFGTQCDVDAVGYEWINHSLTPKTVDRSELRVTVGGPGCTKPYLASRLNISAMSFGALSDRALLALNRGAKIGGFAHNTGEGGLSEYHLQEGGDIIWQIGTAYFGCRTVDGKFDPVLFKEKALLDVVKMIEIKLSQGAKPAHGGVLPKVKITPEIARARGIPMGKDCISPPAHSTFSTPIGLLEFVAQLRELSGGKPVGFKLCMGSKTEFMCICKAMLETGIYPDFITVDGGEGGTGASPVAFTDFVGTPFNEGLSFVNNCLRGINLREHIRIIGSGKIVNSFSMVRAIALGADMFNAARAMMFALGCIQSRHCNTNKCPTGITTQDPRRTYAVDVKLKAQRVANYHDVIMDAFLEVMGAVGVTSTKQLDGSRIYRRVSLLEIKSYEELYQACQKGSLLDGTAPEHYMSPWRAASAHEFLRGGNHHYAYRND